MQGPLLSVRDLKVYFRILKGTVHAVDGVSFALDKGATMGLVGESGCGKTTTAYSIMRLLPPNAMICGGEIRFDGQAVAMSDSPTESLEILKGESWDWDLAAAIPRWEAKLAQAAAGTQVIESERYLLEEREFVERVKELYARRPAPSDPATREVLRRHTLRELHSFTKVRLRARREKEIERKLSELRWKRVSMIFQSAMNAFNPVYRVGDQIAEAILTHEDIQRDEARNRVLQLFDLVGIDRSRVDGYPHEFSGGMRQRSMIAMALALNPQLLIADEPTTALDVIMQDRILAEIRDLQRQLGIAMIIITHDVSVVAEVAEKIGVMYAGKLAEYGNIVDIFDRPANPYTIGLMNAFPSIKGARKRLRSIPGSPPDLVRPPTGCRFHPRCQFAQEVCKRVEPPMVEVATNHWSQCHFAREIYEGSLREN
jgi:peptide/nickel transport system ATP-binding protein